MAALGSRKVSVVMAKIRKNNILEKNRQGKRGLGCGLVFPSAEIIELIGMAGGFDYINLDGEHGLFSPDSVDAMCRVADGFGLTVTARVPNIDSSTINSYLDRGVMGVLGPHIETGEQAQALADACRYTPDGKRSWGGGRGTYYNDSGALQVPSGQNTEFMAMTNKEMLVMAQLETTKAFDNLDQILEVEGIDAFAWGPNDLAQAMGLPGQPNHPQVIEAQQRAAERISAAGRKLSSDILTAVNAPSLVLEGARRFLADNQ
jgi:4-hydroxy-2-oxoheptanedioate aldolase